MNNLKVLLIRRPSVVLISQSYHRSLSTNQWLLSKCSLSIIDHRTFISNCQFKFSANTNKKIINNLQARYKSNSYNNERFSKKFFNVNFPVIIMSTAALIYFSLTTSLLDLYGNLRYPSEKKLQEILNSKQELYKFLFNTINDSHSKNDISDSVNITFKSNIIHPFQLGNQHSRSGVNIYLPHFYMAESVDEIDMAEICDKLKLDKDRLENEFDNEGRTIYEVIKKTLYLSPNAKRFVILHELHSSSLPLVPYLETLLLVCVPGGVYTLAKSRLSQLIKLPLVSFAYLALALFMGSLRRCQQKYGFWAVAQLEKKQDHEENRIVDESLYEGGLEYLNKLKKLQQLIFKYSCEKQYNFKVDSISGDVDEKDWLNLITIYPVRNKLDDFEKFFKEISKNTLNQALYYLTA